MKYIQLQVLLFFLFYFYFLKDNLDLPHQSSVCQDCYRRPVVLCGWHDENNGYCHCSVSRECALVMGTRPGCQMGEVPNVDKSLQDTNKSIQTAQQCLVSVNDVGCNCVSTALAGWGIKIILYIYILYIYFSAFYWCICFFLLLFSC